MHHYEIGVKIGKGEVDQESYLGVTGRCFCTGVPHLSAISWASLGVESQRKASACYCSLSDLALSGVSWSYLHQPFRVVSEGVWKLKDATPLTYGPCSILQLQAHPLTETHQA
ncbi:hypothetical protein CHARACLAT_010072 [Characodon lateralis]|uniref:Uncharacterized protein n=1 Tax=Characodon lateralis TaxID=208331 RepID=A0ABU7CQI1_9TELE|nr:hypothetical protein [Characodon lateralis]